MPRHELNEHLEKCPASVMHCTMEWNRWPVYSSERQARVPFVQDNLHARYGQLDVALALRDQRVLNQAFKAPRSTRRILRNNLTQRFPAVPFCQQGTPGSVDEVKPTSEASQTVSDDDSDAPWQRSKQPPGLQSSVCQELFKGNVCTGNPAAEATDPVGVMKSGAADPAGQHDLSVVAEETSSEESSTHHSPATTAAPGSLGDPRLDFGLKSLRMPRNAGEKECDDLPVCDNTAASCDGDKPVCDTSVWSLVDSQSVEPAEASVSDEQGIVANISVDNQSVGLFGSNAKPLIVGNSSVGLFGPSENQAVVTSTCVEEQSVGHSGPKLDPMNVSQGESSHHSDKQYDANTGKDPLHPKSNGLVYLTWAGDSPYNIYEKTTYCYGQVREKQTKHFQLSSNPSHSTPDGLIVTSYSVGEECSFPSVDCVQEEPGDTDLDPTEYRFHIRQEVGDDSHINLKIQLPDDHHAASGDHTSVSGESAASKTPCSAAQPPCTDAASPSASHPSTDAASMQPLCTDAASPSVAQPQWSSSSTVEPPDEQESLPIPDPPQPDLSLKLQEILALDLNIENITRYQIKPKSMYTFLCAQNFRRDEFKWHIKNVHNDIHAGLNGWMEQRCPLASYGCTYSLRRFSPHCQGDEVIYNTIVESFGVKSQLPSAGVSDPPDHRLPGSTNFSKRQRDISKESTPEIFTSKDYDSEVKVHGNINYIKAAECDNSSKHTCSPDETTADVKADIVNQNVPLDNAAYKANSTPTNWNVRHNDNLLTSTEAGPIVDQPPSANNTKHDGEECSRKLQFEQLPFEMLQFICGFLDGFALCNLALTSRYLRQVCCSLLDDKGIVVPVWERRIQDGKKCWDIAYKVRATLGVPFTNRD